MPFIEGDQFYLRELRLSDLDGNWYNWFNDSKVTRYQNKKIYPNTIEKQQEYFDYLKSSSSDVVFAIVDKEKEVHIGNIGLHHIDWVHRFAELGIVIGETDYFGRKIGKQAWILITKYAFETLNLHRIYAVIMSENTASIKCAEAANFSCDGVIRDYFYKNGSYMNACYFNIIREDFTFS